MKNGLRFWLAAAMAACLVTILLAPLQMMPFGRDQAEFAVGARLLSQQGFSLDSVWTNRPPGIYLWMMTARIVIGPLEENARRLDWIWAILTCMMAAIVAYEWTERSRLAAVAAALLLAVRYLAGGFTQTMQPAGLALLPLLTALEIWGPPGQTRDWRRLFSSGFFLGLATLLEAKAAWAAPALIGFEWLRRTPATRLRIRDAAVFTTGLFALPALLSAVWLNRLDPSLMWQILSARLNDYAAAPLFFPLDWLTMAVLGLLYFHVSPPRLACGQLALLLAVLGLVTLTSSAATDRQLLLGPLAIGAAVTIAEGAAWLRRRLISSWSHRLVIALLALIFFAGGPWPNAARQWHYFRHYLDGLSVYYLADFFNDPESSFSYTGVRETAGAAARLARPDWRIFVWGAEPGIYHYSGLAPAIGCLTLAPALAGGEPRRRVLELFQRQPPEVVVVREKDVLNPHLYGFYDSRAALAVFPSIYRVLTEQYRFAQRAYDFAIYIRRDLPVPLH